MNTLHPIIVVEGPDGAGKTTLANQLVEQLGAKYLHLTYRWGPKMDLYHTAALFYILGEAQKRPVILDRWWMSELVYAAVYRGGSKWPLLHRMLDKVALRHSIIYVMCIPSDRDRYVDHFQKLKAERNEMYSDNMEKVYDGFLGIAQALDYQGHPHAMLYDWMRQGDDVVGFAKSVYEYAYDSRMDNYTVGLVPHNHYNLAGSWNHAKYLLIGDKENPIIRREAWPFFNGSSAYWLAEQLHKLELPEQQFVYINAQHKDQDQTNANIKKAIDKGLRAITLGSGASAHLLQMGIRTEFRINHPRAYARFNPAQGIIDLKEALR